VNFVGLAAVPFGVTIEIATAPAATTAGTAAVTCVSDFTEFHGSRLHQPAASNRR